MSNETDNPVAQSITHLRDCGWTQEEAEHLVGAVQADSAEQLWTIAPKWIEHCSESMRYVRDMLGLVAMGLMTVTMGNDGHWRFQLNDRGIEVGHQLGLPAREFGAAKEQLQPAPADTNTQRALRDAMALITEYASEVKGDFCDTTGCWDTDASQRLFERCIGAVKALDHLATEGER